MVRSIPTTEPSVVFAGDTWEWHRKDLESLYPAVNWALTYYFNKAGTTFSIAANAIINPNGADYFEVKASATATAAYAAGIYEWVAFATYDGERFQVDHGTIEVKPNFATSTSDVRSHARVMLAKIESLIEGRADNDVSNYAINGRSLTKLSLEELTAWRNQYRREVAAETRRERIRRGKASGQTIKVRF